MAKSQAGSPIPSCPKSMTALNLPSCTSKLPALMSPQTNTGEFCQAVPSPVPHTSIAVLMSIMNDKQVNLANFNFKEFQEEAIAKLKSGQALTGKDGVMTPLIKQILEAALEGEMSAHFSDCQSQGIANRRNGKTSKTVKTGTGAFDLETPRDREGSFEPEIVKKRETVLNESLDNKILSLYAIGMSYESIAIYLDELYGLDVSTAKISQITDKLLPLITEWDNRPLEAVYPIVFLDAMHFKIRIEL